MKRDEVQDVYHGLENISNGGNVLCGSGTQEYETWRDETTLELLWNGCELIEQRLNRLERCLAGVPAEYQTTEQKEQTMKQKEQTTEQTKKRTVKTRTAEASEKLEAIGKLRGYLSYHAERWNDRERLAEGRSIGSGQVEGACLLGLQKSGPDRQTLETNRCPMTHQKSPQHGNPLRRTLRKPMENGLE